MGDVLLLFIDEALMQEKLFWMTQVGPGQVHTLCLGSSCVYWDGGDGWWLVWNFRLEGEGKVV